MGPKKPAPDFSVPATSKRHAKIPEVGWSMSEAPCTNWLRLDRSGMSSAETFLFSIIFGAVGLAAFGYGKTTSQPKLMIIGAVLMAYTYLVSDPWLVLGIGTVLSAGLWYAAE